VSARNRSEGAVHFGDAAEMALSHAIGDKVEAAYQRGDLLERRIAPMTDWRRSLAESRLRNVPVPVEGRPR
jgi:hypothetical protein